MHLSVASSQARSDWAPDPARPPAKFSPPRRAPHGVALVGRLFDDGALGHLDLNVPVRGDFEEGFQVSGEHGSARGRGFLPWDR